MSDTKISVQSEKPGIVDYESFDVQSGKNGLSRSEYKGATFHTSNDTSDARFEAKAMLLGSSSSEIMGESTIKMTATEKKEESMGQ